MLHCLFLLSDTGCVTHSPFQFLHIGVHRSCSAPHFLCASFREENIFPSLGFLKMQGDNAGEALDGAAGGPLHLCLVLETSSSFGVHSAP
jgi:hypothetical protein